MNTEQTKQTPVHIGTEQLLAVVRAMMGGDRVRESDESPLPPGPWDPVIRVALERSSVFGLWPVPWKILLASLFARHPEAWDVIGGSPTPGADVALNPQPQPPRFAFLISLAQTVISRAELLGDLAAATQREGEQQGIIVVGGYIARFVEDIGGNDFKLKWPFPWPPPDWFAREVSGIDLVVMAVQFDRAASQSYHRELRQSLANASIKLAETGLAKMQH